MASHFERQAWLAESLQHFRALLRIDTSNPPGCEEPAALYLAAVLERESIEYKILAKAPGRTNLVARLRGRGEACAVLLNGHLDVVPAEPHQWTHPPFAAVEAEGCICARGVIDMENMVVNRHASSTRTSSVLKCNCGPGLMRHPRESPKLLLQQTSGTRAARISVLWSGSPPTKPVPAFL